MLSELARTHREATRDEMIQTAAKLAPSCDLANIPVGSPGYEYLFGQAMLIQALTALPEDNYGTSTAIMRRIVSAAPSLHRADNSR